LGLALLTGLSENQQLESKKQAALIELESIRTFVLKEVNEQHQKLLERVSILNKLNLTTDEFFDWIEKISDLFFEYDIYQNKEKYKENTNEIFAIQLKEFTNVQKLIKNRFLYSYLCSLTATYMINQIPAEVQGAMYFLGLSKEAYGALVGTESTKYSSAQGMDRAIKSRDSAKQKAENRKSELLVVKQEVLDIYLKERNKKATDLATAIERRVANHELILTMPCSGTPVKKEEYLAWIREFKREDKQKIKIK